jgi:hypothetical protein
MQAVMRDIVRKPTREDRMGFMDKAKKLAEQAQEKLDEAQKNISGKQGGAGSQEPAQGGVQYDEHGRPIQQETPAAATPPPAATPSVDAPTEETPAPAPPPAPEQSEGGGGDTNASPDPFKPHQQ